MSDKILCRSSKFGQLFIERLFESDIWHVESNRNETDFSFFSVYRFWLWLQKEIRSFLLHHMLCEQKNYYVKKNGTLNSKRPMHNDDRTHCDSGRSTAITESFNLPKANIDHNVNEQSVYLWVHVGARIIGDCCFCSRLCMLGSRSTIIRTKFHVMP